MDRAAQRKVDIFVNSIRESLEELIDEITGEHQSQLDEKDQKITELESQVAELKTEITEHQGYIAQLEEEL